jgi:hypothetical protein
MIWNERTCVKCAAHGAPNQGRSDFNDYLEALRTYFRDEAAKLASLQKAPAWPSLLSGPRKGTRSRRSKEATLSGQKSVKGAL